MISTSLVEHREYAGVETYLVLNRPIYKRGESGIANILLSNRGEEKHIKVSLVGGDGSLLYSESLKLGAGEEETVPVNIPAPEKAGSHIIKLLVNDTVVDMVEYLVVESIHEPARVALVWHNHQAPNYLPDWTIHSPWAYIYVYGDQLKPYGRGPYHYHIDVLRRHSDYRATFNLSPSLLFQWNMAVTRGVRIQGGGEIRPGDERARLIEETLKGYGELARSGKIDVLTSIYAHTIGGYLVDYLGAYDLVFDEVSYGKRVTSEVLGGYTPLGAWTPEMAFSMKMVDIYYDNNIEYTVLDDVCHFRGAVGEKGSSYEPYIVLDKDTGKHILVAFRDHELSDILSFKNNYRSELHALRNAYEASLRIAKRILDARPRVLTLALDGENWLVFSQNPPLTAYFYDKLVVYLESLTDIGALRLSHLREIFDTIAAKKILTKIPTNSWLCSFNKWRGERQEHEHYWAKVSATLRKLRVYEAVIGGKDEHSEKARWALWHALDSDYWWAEFWLPKIIDTWLNEAAVILDSRLGGIRIREVAFARDPTEGREEEIKVSVENRLDKRATVSLMVQLTACRDIAQGQLQIPANTTVEQSFKLTPCMSGEIEISAAIYADKHVLHVYSKKATVKPSEYAT